MVASNFLFANPFVDPSLTASVDRDLGDAVLGSIFAARHVRAKYGVLPYSFTAGTLSDFSNSSLSLDDTGLLHTGVAGSSFVALPATLPLPFRFLVSAVDSIGTQTPTSEPFLLNILTNQNQFRFAIGPRLSDATRYLPYVDSVPVINGAPSYFFSLLPSSVGGGGKSGLSALESLGLTLTGDGTVYGQPLVSGPITFTVVCKDLNGNSARSRDGTVFNQKLTINVDDNLSAQSTMYITSLTISGNSSKGGNDKLSISGFINLNAIAVSRLSGNVTIRMGSYLSPAATFGAVPGKATNAVTGPGKKPPTLNVTVSSKGQFKMQVTHETFSDLNTLVSGGAGAATAIEVSIGAQLDGVQFLSVGGKITKNHFSGAYRPTIGKTGNPTLAGVFFLTSASGRDDTKALNFGAPYDAWRVGFVAIPQASSTFTGASSATINVGASFQDTETVTAAKGSVKLSAKPASKTLNKVTQLNMSQKGKGTYTTSSLSGNLTGLTLAADGTTPQKYSTSIILTNGNTTVYSGAGSIVIFPGTASWTSTNPSK